jgi:hypothetical protein
MRLALVTIQQLLRWQVGRVECVGGQYETAVLVDEGLAGRTRGGQGPFNVVDPLIGLYAWSGASAFAITGRRAPGTGPQLCGLQVLCEGSKRLPRIGFTRQGDAA